MNKRLRLSLCLGGALILIFAAALYFFSGEPEKGPLMVCLDPGHGGSSSGAVNGERMEKDDTLRLALAVRDILEENKIKVIMTRYSDVDLSLGERCDIANDEEATLFVSLHRNSGGAQGFEVWINSKAPRDASLVATDILVALEEVDKKPNRGVRSGTAADPKKNYAVLGNTDMTACLVEMGFIDSDEDNALFDQNFDAYAAAIAKAIMQ